MCAAISAVSFGLETYETWTNDDYTNGQKVKRTCLDVGLVLFGVGLGYVAKMAAFAAIAALSTPVGLTVVAVGIITYVAVIGAGMVVSWAVDNKVSEYI